MRLTVATFTAVLLAAAAFSSSVSEAATPAPCSGGVVALTYDDGPHPETPLVLDALKRHKLKATFFLVGWNVEARPDIAQRIVREGHEVANHSWMHSDLTLMTPEEAAEDLRKTNEIIRQVTGKSPKFVRPPYGSTNDAVRAAMAKNGLTEVMWSQDSYDWTEKPVDYIVNQLKLVPPGGTYLMHDQMANTLAAVPVIATHFKTIGKGNPVCAGRLERTTNVQPVLDWLGMFYFARAAQWPSR